MITLRCSTGIILYFSLEVLKSSKQVKQSSDPVYGRLRESCVTNADMVTEHSLPYKDVGSVGSIRH